MSARDEREQIVRIAFSIVFVLILAGLPAGGVLAHDGEPHGGGAWGSWNLTPELLIGFLVSGLLYVRGVRILWEKSTRGTGIRPRQVIFFFAGLLVLALALLSPLDALGSASLAWHMIQHLLIILVAALLLILGNPMLAFLSAFPAQALQRGGRWWNRQTNLRQAFKFFAYPLVVWSIHAAVITIWHVPFLYQAALRVEWLHHLEHLSFLIAALLFWWLVLPRPGAVHYPGHGPALLILFTTMLQGGLLGALLTFSKSLWYPIYQESSLLVSATALDDQNIAGILMWIPPSLVYLGVALSILAKMLNPDGEYRGRRLEVYKDS
jgi:putative membrane protein